MSSLVLELQRDALNSRIPIADLLRKAIVVAKKLDVHDIEEWAALELGGYPRETELPPYRMLHGEVKAWNPYRGWIPMVMQDIEHAESLSRRGNMQGVAELEALLNGSDPKGVLQMPFSSAVQAQLMASADVPFVPTLIVSRTEIVGILDTVRNTVLKWSLRLEKDGIVGEGMSFSTEELAKAAEHVYNVTHFHGDVSGSQIQQFTTSSSQSQTAAPDLEAIAAFVSQVREAMPHLALSADQQRELAAELATIDAQTASPKPKAVVLRESLSTVRNILEGATGSLIAAGILSQLPRLLGF